MPQSDPAPELSVPDNSLQSAAEAIRTGQLAQAREILTKLLQADQQNPEYWVWLSAAVETQKERLFCLQTAYKLDPTNASARRGLITLGALAPENPPRPFALNRPRPWEARIKEAESADKPVSGSRPAFRLVALLGLLCMAAIVILVDVVIHSRLSAATPIVEQGTPRPTVTPYATSINAILPQSKLTSSLDALLSTPYTPTPVYAATPHGELAGDSYKAALRAYKNGQWELMGLMMAQVATAQPGSADAIYFIGESYRLSSKYQDAINYYNSAITINPKFAPSYLGRALAEMELAPRGNVLEDLNLAIEVDPGYAEAYIQRGLYYLNTNDLNFAQADLDKAASLIDSPLVELYRARVLLALHDNEAALEAAKRANEMDVTLLDGYLVLGMAYQANGQAVQAAEALETYLKYQSDNAEAFALLGEAYFNQGDYARSEADLLKSLRLDGKNADGYFWLGQTYLAQKENVKALANFQKARDMAPDSFDFGEGLAKAYIAQGEYNNSYIAISKAEKSAVTPEQRARFIYILALSLDHLNAPDAAYRNWSDLLNLPVGAASAEMLALARQRVAALRTPTPTVTLTPAVSLTPTPSLTITRTTAPRPSSTPSK